MDLRQYFQALQKFWVVIVLCGLLGAMIGLVVGLRAEETYRGRVSFFVKTTGEASTNGQFAGDQFAQRRVNSYVALLSTDRMAEMVLEGSGLDLTPGQVSRMISASGDINTVLLTATVTGSSPSDVQVVTDRLAIQFTGLVNELENPEGAEAGVRVEVVSGPSVSVVPTDIAQTVASRMLIGLVAGFAIVMVMELRDQGVRTDEQVSGLGAGPVLGRIPMNKRSSVAPLVMEDEAFGPRAEAFRQLRTNLQFIDLERKVQVIVVSSSMPEEGKSVVSANLAIAMAVAGERVLVIEADFRLPKLSEYFGLERAAGITDVLAGRANLDDVVQRWGENNLAVLPAGQIPPNPSELLGSDAMAALMQRFRAEYDLVVIDSPPLLPVSDAAVISTRADGTLLVVRYGETTRDQLSRSVSSLETVGARLLGSVLTMTPTTNASYGSYAYGEPPQEAADSESARRSPPTELAKAGLKRWRAIG